MTGHMVLSTLHTNNAIATVERFLDMGAAGYLVAAALDAVVAQRLVRRICESCSAAVEPSVHQRAWLRAQAGSSSETLHFRRGPGCAYCSNTGYRGRVGVYEMLELDAGLTDALRRVDVAEFTQLAMAQPGYRPLALCALDYAAAGVTTLEEVLSLASRTDELAEDLVANGPVAEAAV